MNTRKELNLLKNELVGLLNYLDNIANDSVEAGNKILKSNARWRDYETFFPNESEDLLKQLSSELPLYVNDNLSVVLSEVREDIERLMKEVETLLTEENIDESRSKTAIENMNAWKLILLNEGIQFGQIIRPFTETVLATMSELENPIWSVDEKKEQKQASANGKTPTVVNEKEQKVSDKPVSQKMIDDRKKIVEEYYQHLLKEIKKYGTVREKNEGIQRISIKQNKGVEYDAVCDKLEIVYNLKNNLHKNNLVEFDKVLEDKKTILGAHREPEGFFAKRNYASRGQQFITKLEELREKEERALAKASKKKSRSI